MSRLIPVNSTKLIRILSKCGFYLIRQKGSHAFFEHQDGRTTVIPIHKGEDIGKGLLKDILNDIKMSNGEFNQLL